MVADSDGKIKRYRLVETPPKKPKTTRAKKSVANKPALVAIDPVSLPKCFVKLERLSKADIERMISKIERAGHKCLPCK